MTYPDERVLCRFEFTAHLSNLPLQKRGVKPHLQYIHHVGANSLRAQVILLTR